MFQASPADLDKKKNGDKKQDNVQTLFPDRWPSTCNKS